MRGLPLPSSAPDPEGRVRRHAVPHCPPLPPSSPQLPFASASEAAAAEAQGESGVPEGLELERTDQGFTLLEPPSWPKESTKSAEVISAGERSGHGGLTVYEIEYALDSTTGGMKRILSAAFVASRKLYLLNIAYSDAQDKPLDSQTRIVLEQVLHSWSGKAASCTHEGGNVDGEGLAPFDPSTGTSHKRKISFSLSLFHLCPLIS